MGKYVARRVQLKRNVKLRVIRESGCMHEMRHYNGR